MTVDPKTLTRLFRSTPLQQPEDAVGFLLYRVAHRYQREIDRVCAAIDLTHLQFMLLVISGWLARQGDAVTQGELATFSGVHPMQVSNVLKALEAKVYVVRTKMAGDVRVKHVAITPDGVAVVRRALPLVEAAQRRFFGPDQELGVQLHASLRRIVESWGDEP